MVAMVAVAMVETVEPGTGNRNRGPTAEDRLAMQDTADNVLKLHHFVNLSPMVAYVGVQFWFRESFWAAGAS